jgi:DNA-binding transcriptional ArsR family regulator
MVHIGKKLMEHIGLNPERLRIQFMSGGDGILFVEFMNKFDKTVRELGPLGKSEGIDKNALRVKLEAATMLVPYIRLVERERLRLRFQSEEDYSNYFNSDEFNRLFNTLIVDNLAVTEIMLLLKEQPLRSGKIAEMLGLTPSEVSKHLNRSSEQGLVWYDENQKCYALA